MTMPRIAAEAMRARYRDDSLRLAYPLKGWKLEDAPGSGVILTMTAGEGFDVSFVRDESAATAISGDLRGADPACSPQPVPTSFDARRVGHEVVGTVGLRGTPAQ